MSRIKIIDKTELYKDLVSFAPNLTLPIHRWYDLAEGYSSELVRLLICEQNEKPSYCLDPFGGVGTTSLTCQLMGIDCYSFENNPFFADVARAKLRGDYNSIEYRKLIKEIEKKLLNTNETPRLPELESKTFFESTDKEKWIFHQETSLGLVDILISIKTVRKKYLRYQPILKCALGEILIEVSNVARHGKALGYKAEWKNKKTSRKDVHALFLKNCETQFVDLKFREFSSNGLPNNSEKVLLGDAIDLVRNIKANQLDLVITSPPYLNSRDYTDIYRLELWMLGYVSKFEHERLIRERALTSHVQIKLPDVPYPSIPQLKTFIKHIEKQENLWNKNLPNMMKGYFNDMQKLLEGIRPKLKKGGRVYINVSNSAYYNKQIEVDVVLANTAKKLGYRVPEIRIARWINPSGQQKEVGKIRESIIVLEN